jgi:hypothetical protein
MKTTEAPMPVDRPAQQTIAKAVPTPVWAESFAMVLTGNVSCMDSAKDHGVCVIV